MTNLNTVRSTFLDFFARHGHEQVASSPLVPQNDPTLMFVNAGMVPFKNVFTGAESRPYSTATSSQKCVRAGGKHNDLDNVGYTARHHTFFEMLGNFSFGDYFKEQAIVLAWELLTKDFGLSPEKLFVTVYHTDDEAFNLWKKLTGFEDAKILRVPTKDNFWAMGDTGPCGPCSEIFYDHGEKAGAGKWALDSKGNDLFEDRFIEIWNLVFMQFDQKDADTQVALPKPSIDTGMGLERMTALLQGVHDNYDIDLFQTLIDASKKQSGSVVDSVSHRVIADHLRSCGFLIADGVLPSNEGRGYVLRRIMRRAMRHAHMLGCREPLMHQLVPALVGEMGTHYTELQRAEALITETLRGEEERFKETLERGLKLLEEETSSLSKGVTLSGKIAFKLYDTYGFPLDLTQDILRGRGIAVDETGFDACMNEQKQRAKAAWKGSGEEAVDDIYLTFRETQGPTQFVGYEKENVDATIVSIIRGTESVTFADAGDEVRIALDITPFYGESGGQMGDTGTLYKDGTLVGNITDTQKPMMDFHIHHITLKARLHVGDTVHSVIDSARRRRVRANHSATHILHKVLRDVLGDHVTQKGSLVAPDRLRFDISHNKGLSVEEIKEIERRVNMIIWRNTPVTTQESTPDEAIKTGAMALFGEKYGDKVRVVSMGIHEEDLQNDTFSPYSVELCGGTHVQATGDIGLFKIISEGAIASGVRRIEAVTGEDAYAYLSGRDQLARDVADALKTNPHELLDKAMKIVAANKQLEKQLAEAKKQAALGGSSEKAEKEMIGTTGFVGKIYQNLPPKELRGLADSLMKQADAQVVAVITNTDGKASIVIAVAESLTESINAVDLVRAAVETLGGQGGGGKPHMAQGGGTDVGKMEAAVETIKDCLRK